MASSRPTKVVRIDLDKDLGGWMPSKGQQGKHRREIEDRVYRPALAKLGTPLELIKRFGDGAGYEAAVRELEEALYKAS